MDLTWRNFWFESKALLGREFGVSNDLMHVHFGLGLFLACAVLLRTRHNGMLLAWSIVVGFRGRAVLLAHRVSLKLVGHGRPSNDCNMTEQSETENFWRNSASSSDRTCAGAVVLRRNLFK